jgi:hypothetical protein
MHPLEKMRLKFCKPFANKRTKSQVTERVLGSRNDIQARGIRVRGMKYEALGTSYELRCPRCEIRGMRCESFEAALKLG